MPGLSVDGNGNVTGTIELKDGDLIAGQHEIIITGTEGTVAKGRYVNNPSLPVEELRKIYVSGNTGALAPIAQSFTSNVAFDLIAVRLDINTQGGTDDIVLQIREVENGIPSPTKILAESRLDAIATEDPGTYSEFVLSPMVPILTDREYCFTVQTNNVNYTLAVAELGGIDLTTGNAVAKQPNAGVLYTSSNGTAWSIEQNKDIKFQLVGAEYASTTREIELGYVEGTNISDFLLLANTEITDSDGQIYFVVTDPDDETYLVDKDGKVTMSSKKTGNFSVKAVIKGNASRSPILYPNTQLVLGEINESGDHYSTYFAVPDSFDIKVIVESKPYGSGNYTVFIEDTDANSFTELSLDGSEVMTDGWIKSTWSATGITEVESANISSIKITAECPTVASRIFLRNLKAFTE